MEMDFFCFGQLQIMFHDLISQKPNNAIYVNFTIFVLKNLSTSVCFPLPDTCSDLLLFLKLFSFQEKKAWGFYILKVCLLQ